MTQNKEPAWLTRKVDRKIQGVLDMMGRPKKLPDSATLLMLTLTEPGPGATDVDFARWEQTCDGCGQYVQGKILTGHVARDVDGIQVLVTFGACQACLDKEPV